MLWRGPSSLLRRITSQQHQSQAPLVLQRVNVEVHLKFKCLTFLLSWTSIFLSFQFTFHKKKFFVPALESPTSYGMDAFTNILSCRSVARLIFDVFCSVRKREQQPTDELSTVKRWDIVVTRATHWGHTWFKKAPKDIF